MGGDGAVNQDRGTESRGDTGRVGAQMIHPDTDTIAARLRYRLAAKKHQSHSGAGKPHAAGKTDLS